MSGSGLGNFAFATALQAIISAYDDGKDCEVCLLLSNGQPRSLSNFTCLFCLKQIYFGGERNDENDKNDAAPVL